MDPIIDNDWLGCKNKPVDDCPDAGNVVRSWQWRECGIDPINGPPNKTVLENVAEDILVQKRLDIRRCDLPGYPRSTFLMVFSPDGTKVASTHGNHNVYVSELATGKHVRILKGHPRTPWCIAFHPSHTQLIGSGCLGGQVRVWDLSGGSETWTVDTETVIASIAFHPRDQLLVIATFNELYFWDWSQPAPFTKVSTNNFNEKVRYVAFDSLGYKLITGISVWSRSGSWITSLSHTTSPQGGSSNNENNNRRDSPNDNPGNRQQDNSGSAQEMIVNSYQHLVQRYDSLVRNYQRLFMARHQLTNNPPPNTTDRGTDPMETDLSSNTSTTTEGTSNTPPLRNTTNHDDTLPGPSRRHDRGDGDNSRSRPLNLDVLSFDTNPTLSRPPNATESSNTHEERPMFGSRTSAFQPLHENSERRVFFTTDRNQRVISRLLPNPFSSTSGISAPNRPNFANTSQPSTSSSSSSTSTSRTSVFVPHRQDGHPARFFLHTRRNTALILQQSRNTSSPSPATTNSPSSLPPGPSSRRSSNIDSSNVTIPVAEQSQRPSTTNSSTQISPAAAQTINESLDLIRDILRDSGTRLLNLITNMSVSSLTSEDMSVPRRTSSLTQSDDSEGTGRSRSRRPARLFNSRFRREFLYRGSDSDSDQSLEVNIYRTRNSSFSEETSESTDRTPVVRVRSTNPSDRMVVNLNINDILNRIEGESSQENTDGNGLSVSATDNRFRVRTQNSNSNDPETTNRQTSPDATLDDRMNRPSTSRDNYWMNDPLNLSDDSPREATSSAEAYRKVRFGVVALNRHAMILNGMWLRGARISLRNLRKRWDTLRRRVLSLQRQTGRHDVPTHYTRTIMQELARQAFVSNVNNNSSGPGSTPTNDNTTQNSNDESQTHTRNNRHSDINVTLPSTSAASSNVNRSTTSARTSKFKSNMQSPRRRVTTSGRPRPEDERGQSPNFDPDLGQFMRSGREDMRAVELPWTKNYIRASAMEVLSIILNMMMNCLEERNLSQDIICMLKFLKKALSVTCLLFETSRTTQESESPASNPQEEAMNVDESETNEQNQESTSNENNETLNAEINIENPIQTNLMEDHNMDENNDSSSSWSTSDSDEEKLANKTTDEMVAQNNVESTTNTATTSTAPHSSQTWSDRLAVQISAANRNYSRTARNRRENYLESKRQKVLHRCNPTAHPLMKKKILPPPLTYKIPIIRCSLPKPKIPIPPKQNNQNANNEPVAGPSNPQPVPGSSSENSPQDPRGEGNEFEYRFNLFRIAHMHAVRVRNATRNRFRRLHAIRLYSENSVREMLALQMSNNDNQAGNLVPMNNTAELGNRWPIAAHRPHILTTRNELGNREGGRQFESILNNVAVPLVQVNEGQGNQAQGPPRVHEYLQPILLAQNALVVEEGGGVSTGASTLLDCQLGLPNPIHRVQAWDFTAGRPPNIADSTRNVVVSKCKIHNDASIDISKDGRLLVALLPLPRFRSSNYRLGVYSLEWSNLGRCLYTTAIEQGVVSVALSPTARYLAVGLGSRRFTTLPHARNNVFALVFKISSLESSSGSGLSPVKELTQDWEQGFASLNCLRWAPQPGQGLLYASNTGQLIIMS